MRAIKKIIKPLIPAALLRRIRLAKSAKTLREFYFGRQLGMLKPLMFQTGETHNFTYDLTDQNLRYLAEMIAIATQKSPAEIEGYIEEAQNDRELRAYFDSRMAAYDGQKSPKNIRSPFGRRLGWYAVGLAFGFISWVYDPITAGRRRVTRERPAEARNHRKYVLFADGRHPRRIGRKYHSIDGKNGRRGGSLQWLTNADNVLRPGHRNEFCGGSTNLGKTGDRFERTIDRGPCEFVTNFGNRYCI